MAKKRVPFELQQLYKFKRKNKLWARLHYNGHSRTIENIIWKNRIKGVVVTISDIPDPIPRYMLNLHMFRLYHDELVDFKGKFTLELVHSSNENINEGIVSTFEKEVKTKLGKRSFLYTLEFLLRRYR